MKESERAALRQILLTHGKKYPLMTPCDAVKLLYQNEFGGGHLIRDRASAMARLRAEYEATPRDPSLPVYEEIGGGLVRVMLAAVDPGQYPLEALLDGFIRSAAEHTGSRESFLEKLTLLRESCSQGALPFSCGALDEYLETYIAAGCPMVSHSEAYRSAYRPAYRVVLRRHCPSA